MNRSLGLVITVLRDGVGTVIFYVEGRHRPCVLKKKNKKGKIKRGENVKDKGKKKDREMLRTSPGKM